MKKSAVAHLCAYYCIAAVTVHTVIFLVQCTGLWRAAYAPGDGQTSPAHSIHSVQYLYINQLLPANKAMLSYLLLCLLPQGL